MLGRVLFAFVCLIIAAGLVLPLYPRDVVTSVVAAASDPVQPVAATDAFGCGACSVADGDAACRSDCPCDHVVPAVFVPLEARRTFCGCNLPGAGLRRARTPAGCGARA